MAKISPADPDMLFTLGMPRIKNVCRILASHYLSLILLAIGAGATAGSAWLLKPVLNHMVAATGFADLRKLSFVVAGLFLVRGCATYGYLVLLSRTGNNIVASVQ